MIVVVSIKALAFIYRTMTSMRIMFLLLIMFASLVLPNNKSWATCSGCPTGTCEIAASNNIITHIIQLVRMMIQWGMPPDIALGITQGVGVHLSSEEEQAIKESVISEGMARGILQMDEGAPVSTEQMQEAINAVPLDSILSGSEFGKHQIWLKKEFFADNVLRAMMMMTEQLSAVAFQQVLAIGQFFDAKQQMETHRTFQTLLWEAHRDYQPSEDFCWFGTGMRSIAASEQRSSFNEVALSKRQMDRLVKKETTSGAEETGYDYDARWKQFKTVYCNKKDNGWKGENTGLDIKEVCDGGDPARYNIDVDYTRLVEEPRSLDVKFFEGQENRSALSKEQDVMAMAMNLFGHELPQTLSASKFKENETEQMKYLRMRTLAAKRSVAMNSFNSIVGLKSYGSDSPVPETRKYLAALLVELGVPVFKEDGTTLTHDVYKIMGEHPSYYAQLELLAKKIYQNPDFYVNLYDKPANVERKSVALKAIDLMLGREMFESQLRREMAISVLLATRLRVDFDDILKKQE